MVKLGNRVQSSLYRELVGVVHWVHRLVSNGARCYMIDF